MRYRGGPGSENIKFKTSKSGISKYIKIGARSWNLVESTKKTRNRVVKQTNNFSQPKMVVRRTKPKKRGRMDPADIQLESFFTLYLIWSMLDDFENKNFFDLIPICHVKSVAQARFAAFLVCLYHAIEIIAA